MAILIGDKKCFVKQRGVHFLTPKKKLVQRVRKYPHLPILLNNLPSKVKESIHTRLPHRYLLDLDAKEILVGTLHAKLLPNGTFLDASRDGWLDLLKLILACCPLPVIITDSFSEILPLLDEANILYRLYDVEALPYPLLRIVFSYLTDAELFSLLHEDITFRKRLENDLPFWRDRSLDPFFPEGETAAEHYLRQMTEMGSFLKGSERYLGLGATLDKAIATDNLDLFLYLLQRGAVWRSPPYISPEIIFPTRATPSPEVTANWYVFTLSSDILRYLALDAQVKEVQPWYYQRIGQILSCDVPTSPRELAFVKEGLQRISKSEFRILLNIYLFPPASIAFIQQLRPDIL